jgi:putative Mn2+ efflux pump MntP
VHPVTVFLIAFALSLDALAVSVAAGIAIRSERTRHAFRLAAWFGGFQALMPFLGWLAGTRIHALIRSVDHWAAFALLVLIGGKMIYQATRIAAVEQHTDLASVRVLFVLAVATSLDALAVGISFAMQRISIATPILTIGGVTFAVCFAGVWIGEKVGHFFEKKIEILGGSILIAIGIKVLVEHMAT